MNVALGTMFLTLGLAASLVGAVSTTFGIVNNNVAALQRTRTYVWLILLGATGAFVIMERALITRDFTVSYVAEVGSTKTAPLFNFAALWSALEGSLLLWALVLAGYLAVVMVKFRDRLTDPLVAWAMVTLFVITAFFFVLLIGPAAPFRSFDPPPGYDGFGPNPLLQNHVLVAFHPPMLYLGYVGFTVPFAFAIAALATGRLGEGWLVETRRWTLFAWGFLTGGIVLGAWWAYEVLGWGGYWGWDPVENASLLPWLTGTAYLHSVMVQERRGMLRVWNLSLVCATFSLTILGTFLTRSGVIESVHAFSEGGIGPLLLAFFVVTSLVTVGLIIWRGDLIRSPGRIDSPLSREASFLVNNIAFGAFAFIVLFGTVWPLVVEAVNGDRINVGRPYFDRMGSIVGLVLLFLMAIAPVLPWRKTTVETLSQRLQVPIWIGAGSMVFALVVGARGFSPVLAFGLGGFAAGSALRQLVLATRRQGWRGLVGRTNGGMVVHLGVIMMAIAIAASSSFVAQTELRMLPGDSAEFKGHTLTYEGWSFVSRDVLGNRDSLRVAVDIDGKVYEPAIDSYLAAQQSIGDPVTRTSLTDDVQVDVLNAPTEDSDEVLLRVTVQPLVIWLWIGGIMMLVGTVLSIFPGRRRQPTAPVSAPAAMESVDG